MKNKVNNALYNGSSNKYNAVFIAILSVISVLIVIPLLYIVSISFSSDGSIVKYGYKLVPKEFSLEAYKYLLNAPDEILNAYAVSISVTICGTILGLVLTSTLAYLMIRKDYKFSKFTTFFVFFPMLFSGGTVPWYIVMKNVLHVDNTFFALFISV